jgi:hypothetical protein
MSDSFTDKAWINASDDEDEVVYGSENAQDNQITNLETKLSAPPNTPDREFPTVHKLSNKVCITPESKFIPFQMDSQRNKRNFTFVPNQKTLDSFKKTFKFDKKPFEFDLVKKPFEFNVTSGFDIKKQCESKVQLNSDNSNTSLHTTSPKIKDKILNWNFSKVKPILKGLHAVTNQLEQNSKPKQAAEEDFIDVTTYPSDSDISIDSNDDIVDPEGVDSVPTKSKEFILPSTKDDLIKQMPDNISYINLKKQEAYDLTDEISNQLSTMEQHQFRVCTKKVIQETQDDIINDMSAAMQVLNNTSELADQLVLLPCKLLEQFKTDHFDKSNGKSKCRKLSMVIVAAHCIVSVAILVMWKTV